MQKPMHFYTLITNCLKKSSSIYNTIKEDNKYLRINLMKETKVCTLKTVTYRGKKLKKKNKQKDIPCSWTGGLLLKCP